MKNLMKSMKTIVFKLSPISSKIYWLSLDFNNLFFLLVEDASSKKESHFIVAQCIQKYRTLNSRYYFQGGCEWPQRFSIFLKYDFPRKSISNRKCRYSIDRKSFQRNFQHYSLTLSVLEDLAFVSRVI